MLGREIRFDGWTLKPESGELYRDGRRVRLQSQPMQVLEALLERPGEMVAREQLIARLWPRGIVDFDTALNSTVRRLRTALGDQADTPRYIETIPKRGYRFIAALEPATPEPATSTPAVASEPAAGLVPRHASPARQPRSLRWILASATLAVLVAVGLGAWSWTRSPARPASTAAAPAMPVPAAAFERLQQARFLLQRRGPGDVARAREHFTAALRIAPGFARAWSGLASTWWIDTMEGRVSRSVGLARTREAATHALQFDPRLAEAHLRLANVYWTAGDREAADAHVRQAMTAEPDDPLVLSFAASTAVGRGAIEEGVALQRRAVEADPLSLVNRHNLAVMLFVDGRFAEAKAELLELFELNPTASDGSDLLLAQTLVLNGEPEAALALSERMHDEPDRLQARVLAFHALGRTAESDAALRELSGQPLGRRGYLVAEAHAFRGETDAAFASLQAIVDADEAACTDARCWPLDWLESLPLLRPLRADARWSAWLADVRAKSTG